MKNGGCVPGVWVVVSEEVRLCARCSEDDVTWTIGGRVKLTRPSPAAAAAAAADADSSTLSTPAAASRLRRLSRTLHQQSPSSPSSSADVFSLSLVSCQSLLVNEQAWPCCPV